jgi:hypothetical protein
MGLPDGALIRSLRVRVLFDSSVARPLLAFRFLAFRFLRRESDGLLLIN